MQEEVTQRTISLAVETSKMTADVLQKAVKKLLQEMQKKPSQRILRQGKQTLHQHKQQTKTQRLLRKRSKARTGKWRGDRNSE